MGFICWRQDSGIHPIARGAGILGSNDLFPNSVVLQAMGASHHPQRARKKLVKMRVCRPTAKTRFAVPACLVVFMLLLAVVHRCAAEQAQVRYHFGDDTRWADPHFDDSAWPVAQRGLWPIPDFYSDGFVWVRFQVPVRSDLSGALSIGASDPRLLLSSETFVNGKLVGSFGRVPPRVWVESNPRRTVDALPDGLVDPGSTGQVTLRLWYPPSARRAGAMDSRLFEIEHRRTLNAEAVAEIAQVRLANTPAIMLNLLLMLVAFLVLASGRLTLNRDLLLSGGVLLFYPLFLLFFELIETRILNLNTWAYFPLELLVQLPGMWVTVEFIWRINGLKGIWFKRLALAAMAVFNVSMLVAYMSMQPSAVVHGGLIAYIWSLQVFNLVTIGANLWVVFVKRRNVVIAASMALIPIGSTLSGFRVSFASNAAFASNLNLFDLASVIATVVLSVALAYRAWKEWRARDALHTEFEAAREVQQRLVTPASNVPGFEVESAYAPAAHVGGDFFFVRPEEGGGVLVVVGDVSGKGLRAALTVSAIMGALRTMAPLPPSQILGALNRGMAGQLNGGFVTSCAAPCPADGTVALANAGHLAPYCNGIEVETDANLPLGIDENASYSESVLTLADGDALTFVSDGVVEARGGTGEMFGFERTREISGAGAAAIAKVAQEFGQEDDITVVRLRRTALVSAVA